MYRIIDFRRRRELHACTESELLTLGFTAEDILTMLCGMHVRGCMIEMVGGVRVVDPCSLQEIADITGMAVPTVSGIVQRALNKMARKGSLKAFLRGIRAARRRGRGEVTVTLEIECLEGRR